MSRDETVTRRMFMGGALAGAVPAALAGYLFGTSRFGPPSLRRARHLGSASLRRAGFFAAPPRSVGGVGAAAAGVDGLGGRRIFPSDNPWNQDISREPVDPHSEALIASIGLDKPLHPDYGGFWEGRPIGIPFVVVPGSQPKVPVRFQWADESDPGPYPIPPDPPIEGGSDSDGDRHIIVIDRDHWRLYELYSARLEGQEWSAGSGAIFDLNSNRLRPAGWTSADGAGLPIFPGLVRYDEAVERGAIRHALRFTCRRTRRAYVTPARHFASRLTDPGLPPMGMRVRLQASYDTSSFPPAARAVLDALKRYGMILADNGSDWFLSGTHDPRWDLEEQATLKRVQGRDFEVVRMGPIVTR